MTKKRVQGTDAAPYVKKQATQKPSNNSKVSFFLNSFFCFKSKRKRRKKGKNKFQNPKWGKSNKQIGMKERLSKFRMFKEKII